MTEIKLKLNSDDPFNYYLENSSGDRFYFKPLTGYGEELNNFLGGCRELNAVEREAVGKQASAEEVSIKSFDKFKKELDSLPKDVFGKRADEGFF